MRNLWLAAVVGSMAILLVGCPEKPIEKSARIVLHLNEDGSIDTSRHELVKVGPGYRVEFACNCEGERWANTEFWVKDLEHLGEIGATVDHLAQLDALMSDLQRMEAAAQAEPEPGAAEMTPAEPDSGVEEVTPAEAARAAEVGRIQMQVQQLGPRLWGERRPELDGSFGAEWQERPTPRTEVILSEPYPRLPGDQLFKFTWVVRHGDGREFEWDPHIAGMEKYP